MSSQKHDNSTLTVATVLTSNRSFKSLMCISDFSETTNNHISKLLKLQF